MFIIKKPLNWIRVNQPFGVNYVDFYTNMGLKGHNGEDYKCDRNLVRSAFDGIVTFSGKDSDGGIYFEQISDYFDKDGYFKSINYHLYGFDRDVKKGQRFLAGQPMAISGNTGKYTTGPHLHFGLKRCDIQGNTLNYNNGYKGAIDPRPYTEDDYYLTRAEKRYGSARDIQAELLMKLKHYRLNTNQIMALVYGGWGYTEVINDSMADIFYWVTRDEYKNKVTFDRLMMKDIDKIIL